MSQFKVLILLAITLSFGVIAATLVAQESTTASSTGKKLILGYRMMNWKANHIHDSKAAATQADMLRKLGCEVKTAQHDGHSDVQFRTVVWKSLALDTPEQLQQWKAWLETTGFDVLHGRPASSEPVQNADGTHKEVVKYRLAEWRSQHIHQPAEVGQLSTLYRSLACETELLDHTGHKDLRYRCPDWMEIELPSHEAAHKWQEFLKNAGFETAHEH